MCLQDTEILPKLYCIPRKDERYIRLQHHKRNNLELKWCNLNFFPLPVTTLMTCSLSRRPNNLSLTNTIALAAILNYYIYNSSQTISENLVLHFFLPKYPFFTFTVVFTQIYVTTWKKKRNRCTSAERFVN